jgi:hypothetical protein
MKQFISLHHKEDNSIIGINIDILVCATLTEDNKCTKLYIQGDEYTIYLVNETPAMIMKLIGETRKFILVHSRSINNDVIIRKDIIRIVKTNPDGSSITINNPSFNDIEVNEKATSVIEMLNS